MADTIANLIDKLVIMNMKIWKMEDEKRKLSILDNHQELRKNVVTTNYLNTERNNLMSEIDREITIAIEKYVKNGEKPKIHNNLKIYGE